MITLTLWVSISLFGSHPSFLSPAPSPWDSVPSHPGLSLLTLNVCPPPKSLFPSLSGSRAPYPNSLFPLLYDSLPTTQVFVSHATLKVSPLLIFLSISPSPFSGSLTCPPPSLRVCVPLFGSLSTSLWVCISLLSLSGQSVPSVNAGIALAEPPPSYAPLVLMLRSTP